MGNIKPSNHATQIIDMVSDQWSTTVSKYNHLCVGLSGGLDSVVLLHILRQLQQKLPIHISALHVHHGISAHADDWQKFVEQLCFQWNIPLQTIKITLQQSSLGLEAAARQARYHAFSQVSADAIVLAHHQDDQIETFFLSALRGGSLRALSSMPTVRSLNDDIHLWRPLLLLSRSSLENYAHAFNLSHIEDESNLNTHYLRNWLRLEGLPSWRQHLPHLNKHIQASISVLQEEKQLLDEVIQQDWHLIHQKNGLFQVNIWRQLSPIRRKQQLRLFAQCHQLGSPRSQSIINFDQQLFSTNSATAQWSLPSGLAHYTHEILWPESNDTHISMPWLEYLPCQASMLINQNNITLQSHSYGLNQINPKWRIRIINKQDQITISGDRIRNALSILKDKKIPVFLRINWPVLISEDNHCIALLNIMVSAQYAIPTGAIPIIKQLPAQCDSDGYIKWNRNLKIIQ